MHKGAHTPTQHTCVNKGGGLHFAKRQRCSVLCQCHVRLCKIEQVPNSINRPLAHSPPPVMFRRRSKDEIKACRASPALPGSVADVADMSPVPVHVQSRPTSSATSRPPNSTFFHESSLPTLPIPSASSALRRYLETVKPIQTAAAHLQTIAIVTKFIETDTHTELHNKLTDYAATRPSFIEEFWTDAYLVPDT